MTEKIKTGKVKMAFCPMHDVLGDSFIKSLQGILFTRMRGKCLWD